MTLDTRIFILDQIDPRETFHFCRDLLGATDLHTFSDDQDGTWRKGESFVEPGNPWTISNNPGQGLPAWLMLHYRPDAPLRTPEQAAAHDEDCNLPENAGYVAEWGPCDGKHHRRACWLTVSFDTAYGYRDDRGYGCGDLHAEYIAKLGQWLDAKGVRWEWENEFTGEIHTGYSKLIDLASGGFEAGWGPTAALLAEVQCLKAELAGVAAEAAATRTTTLAEALDLVERFAAGSVERAVLRDLATELRARVVKAGGTAPSRSEELLKRRLVEVEHVAEQRHHQLTALGRILMEQGATREQVYEWIENAAAPTKAGGRR